MQVRSRFLHLLTNKFDTRLSPRPFIPRILSPESRTTTHRPAHSRRHVLPLYRKRSRNTFRKTLPCDRSRRFQDFTSGMESIGYVSELDRGLRKAVLGGEPS